MPVEHPSAIVLTGTGANACYEVGVMKAILRDEWGIKGKDGERNPPVQPFGYAATSSGALNAAIMVAHAGNSVAAALDDLEHFWTDQVAVERAGSATGFFRIRAEPTQYLNMDSMLSPLRPFADLGADMLHFAVQAMQRVAYAATAAKTLPDGAVQVSELGAWLDWSPLIHLVQSAVDPQRIATSGKKLLITAVNWETGVPHIFGNLDFEGIDARQIVLAAAALPVMMAAQSVDGVPYVDSSVLFDAPLKPAILAAPGAGESRPGDLVLHTIYVDSQVARVQAPPVSNTFSTVYRLFMLAASRAINADISRAAIINERIRTFELLDSLARRGNKDLDAALAQVSDEAPILFDQLHRDIQKKRLLTIHRFRPSKNVRGFELTQFERQQVRQLIQQGYLDGLHHDCNANGCILPRIRSGRE